jgi:hypothetical protein
MNRRCFRLAALLLMTSGTQAIAQAPPARPPTPAPAQPAPADPKACAPGERLELGEDLPKHPPNERAISEKLARTHGVLCPPSVNPDIAIPAPPAGRIQVIPAPGTPGGDPTVQPK